MYALFAGVLQTSTFDNSKMLSIRKFGGLEYGERVCLLLR